MGGWGFHSKHQRKSTISKYCQSTYHDTLIISSYNIYLRSFFFVISGMDGRPVSNVELQLPNLMQISQKISQLAITTRGYRLTLIIPVSQGSRLPGTKFLEINPVGRCSCVSRAPPILAHHFISCFFFQFCVKMSSKYNNVTFSKKIIQFGSRLTIFRQKFTRPPKLGTIFTGFMSVKLNPF